MRNLYWAVFFFLSMNTYGASVELPLRFEKTLVDQGFVSPVVSAQINGAQGIFLIDSGAQLTVVSRWFSEQAKIRTVQTGSVGGTTGENAKTSLASVDLFIKDSKVTTVKFKRQSVLVVDLPVVFQEFGIAGIISPQQLLEKNQFGTLKLTENPSFNIDVKPSQNNKQFLNLNTYFSDGPNGKKTVLFILDAIVDNIKTSFIVDTGADEIGIGLKTEAGQKLVMKSIPDKKKIGGITGKPEEARVVPQAIVKVLGRDLTMKIHLHPIGREMAADGMLGMNFLKNCTLVLALKTGSIYCP